jgi:hypothetical protein
MTGIASLFGLALAVSVVFAVWRISSNVRKIRKHLDFIAPAMRAAWKHQGIEFATPAEIEEAASSSAPPAVAAPAPSPQLQSLNFSGTGQQATSPADFEKALYVFRLTHSGTGHFTVWVMDSAGNRVELLVNTVGRFADWKTVQIPAKGRYLLDVNADGKWSITAGAP